MIDTTPLKKVIQAWRELNAARVEVLSEFTTDDEGNRAGPPGLWEKLEKLEHQELFNLRDIAGEAMQLVDDIELFSGATPLANQDGQPLVAVKVNDGTPT